MKEKASIGKITTAKVGYESTMREEKQRDG